MTLRKYAIAVLACGLAVGCYKQVPLNTTSPAPATRVIATLTDSGTLAMGNTLGPGAMEVEGVVSTASESQWTLRMIRVEHRGGQSVMWNREPVPFSPVLLTNPVAVRLDKTKSWLVAGGLVVGAFVIAKSFNLIGGDDPGPGGQEPELTVVPAILGGRR